MDWPPPPSRISAFGLGAGQAPLVTCHFGALVGPGRPWSANNRPQVCRQKWVCTITIQCTFKPIVARFWPFWVVGHFGFWQLLATSWLHLVTFGCFSFLLGLRHCWPSLPTFGYFCVPCAGVPAHSRHSSPVGGGSVSDQFVVPANHTIAYRGGRHFPLSKNQSVTF